MTKQIKQDDTVICVHEVSDFAKVQEGKHFIQPDIRSPKPSAFYIVNDKKTAFFQKAISIPIKNKTIKIVIPNEIALSLNISIKCAKSAKVIREKINTLTNTEDTYIFEGNSIELVYDYLELTQKAIIFAYKAVESFCNASIPDDYEYVKESNRGPKEIYNKNNIERWIQTSEKLTLVLPICLNTQNPNTEKFWSDFKELEHLRNDLVHSKSKTEENNIQKLFSPRIDTLIDSSVKLIEFFVKKDPYNPIFPLGFGISKVRSMQINELSEVFKKM